MATRALQVCTTPWDPREPTTEIPALGNVVATPVEGLSDRGFALQEKNQAAQFLCWTGTTWDRHAQADGPGCFFLRDGMLLIAVTASGQVAYFFSAQLPG